LKHHHTIGKIYKVGINDHVYCNYEIGVTI